MRCIVCDEKVRWWQTHCYRLDEKTNEKLAVIHSDCIDTTIAEWIYQELLEELESIKGELDEPNQRN